ncbi:MAG: MarC family protein [Spirochaetaceae bacterium]|jgi:multiple antibiotic resistance protein|nr:MarC family protein [Spirochaetaceae bacterium]
MLAKFLPVFLSMFIMMDPIGLVPLYIGITALNTAEEKKRIIRKAVCIAFILSCFFTIAGKYILELLQIESGSFYIAGGITLFIVALEMLFGRTTATKVSARQPQDDEQRVSVAIFPLAIPMLVGPGTITTIILFTSEDSGGLSVMLMLFTAIVLVLIIVYLMLSASDLILKRLGRTGVTVLERIMGMLLSGMAVQFVYDGLLKLNVVNG